MQGFQSVWVTISLLNQSVDVHSYLFGDILTVSPIELGWVYIGGALVLVLLLYNWSSLVLMTINEDLARAENVRVFFTHLLLMFLMNCYGGCLHPHCWDFTHNLYAYHPSSHRRAN